MLPAHTLHDDLQGLDNCRIHHRQRKKATTSSPKLHGLPHEQTSIPLSAAAHQGNVRPMHAQDQRVIILLTQQMEVCRSCKRAGLLWFG